MVFPKCEGNKIDTQIVMVVDAIFTGIGKEEEAKKHYSLAPIIMADIYRSLRFYKNEFQFFRGCNIFFNGGLLNKCVKKMEPYNRKFQDDPDESPWQVQVLSKNP